jgi:hypothetical protein
MGTAKEMQFWTPQGSYQRPADGWRLLQNADFQRAGYRLAAIFNL